MARELVLVGGGHAHIQVLKRLAMAPPPGARLTVVVDRPMAIYSGMVPGFVAGRYTRSELEIDVVPLARRARARVILARATGIDAERRRIELTGRPSVRYDVASFDIGSTVAGLDVEGVREHALPTRPIADLVGRFESALSKSGRGGVVRVVVVGGGAGGVELTFALNERLRRECRVEATLIERKSRLLAAHSPGLGERVRRAAAERRIAVRLGASVERVTEGFVELEGGERLDFDLLFWVAGASGWDLFGASGLPVDAAGFVKVQPTLQVDGFPELFAAGDCATLVENPDTPKAGVYAVRQGPYLADNLTALLAGGPLRRYRPQSDFLTLLNLGDGTAIGSKWGRAVEGRAAMRLKDGIDRRFMRKFQVLDESGEPTSKFARERSMDEGEPMLCGGCAAKVGQSVLERALARLVPAPADDSIRLGLAEADDAAAYQTPHGDVVVTSTDAFRAFTDDPFLVGRVSAVNALSDLYAKGVEGRYALATVAVPSDLTDVEQEELLYQVLAGARAAFDALGVTLVGGHSTTSAELLVGFTVDGILPVGAPLLRKDGLEPGMRLVLSKALGTGVVLHGDMLGRTRGPWLEATIESVLKDNREGSRLARRAGVVAATDITGFGIAGHLVEMARASGVSVTVDLSALPVLPGAVELLTQGYRSTFHAENEKACHAMEADEGVREAQRFPIVFDPQTSGGLLLGIAEDRANQLTRWLCDSGYTAAVVGSVAKRQPSSPWFRLTSGIPDQQKTASSAGDVDTDRQTGAKSQR